MGWSDLPSDLVISIAGRLSEAGDYLRFRAVCRSWKSAVRAFPPSSFPWLAEIRCNDDGNTYQLSFFSHVATNYVCKCPVPYCSRIEFYYLHIVKDGWIMSVLKDCVAIIFNPVTGAQLQPLPSLNSAGFRRIHSVFLSDNLFAIAVAHRTDEDHLLLAAAPGDDTWSVINPPLRYYFYGVTGIVFHEADHKFYAVDCEGKLFSFSLTRCGGKTVVGEVSALLRRGRERWHLCEARLVSCGSNLLLVGKPSQQRKKDFKILEYRPDANKWTGVTDIGNYSIFIDSHAAKVLAVPQGEEGRLRRNCIYFFRYLYINPSPVIRVKIYDVSKGIEEPEPCFSINVKSDFFLYPDLMWFMPSLSINN